MKRFLMIAAIMMVARVPAIAQTTTAIGTGTSTSTSTAQSNAVAIGGGNATGGQGGTANSALTINSNTPAATTATINNTGTSTVRNVPTVFAPGLTASALETCLGSVSAGAAVVGTGASFGTTVPDAGCQARLDARTLWAFGLKKAAVIRLCLMPEIYKSMSEICVMYMPRELLPYGVAAAVEPAVVMASATGGTGGPIELIDGKTGKTRLCDNYDSGKQKCRRWSH